MKARLTIGMLLLMTTAFAQTELEKLALELTGSCHTDREKVTNIFQWITDHISYRTPNNIKVIGKLTKRLAGELPEIDTSPLKPLSVRVAESVYQNRVAVCDGYARLFTTLCDYAHIPSEVIVGYARSNLNKPGSRFGVNHYWNAVYLDGGWHLLDATWASGYVLNTGEFEREYDARYFLADPADFIRDHFPDDPRWTLLPDAVMPDEFRQSPFKQKSFVKYRITSFLPARGVIEASLGEVISLELSTADPDNDQRISPDLLLDSAIYTHSISWVFLDPVEKPQPGANTFRYEYKVDSPDVQWLYLKYNNDLVLRYKLNIKKKKA